MLNYKSLYKNRISPALGKRKIKDIERREVLKLQSDIYKECTRNTTNKIMNILHQLMKAAMLDGIIVRNVCSSLDGLKDRAEDKAARETIHRALTEKEIKLFLKYAEQSWYFNVFRLMLETGMRAGEVCALEWRDIDINKNVIHVRRTITKGVNGKNQIGKTTKTKRSTRDIPLNAEILGILSDMRTLYNDRHGDNVKRIDGLIVQTENGNIASALNVTSAMNTVIHKAAKNGHILQGFTSHAFRATFASKCIEQGMAPNTLKEIMGHASLAMTMDLYGHVYEEQKQEAMQNIHVIKSVDFKKTDSKANS